MSYELPIVMEKEIEFPKLSNNNVLKYEIYAKYPDKTYINGIRTELIDTITAESVEDTFVEQEYTYDSSYTTYNNTYKLPDDIYLDNAHNIYVYVDDVLISNLWFIVNKMTKVFTINENKIDLKNGKVTIKIKYFKNVVKKTYVLSEECNIFVKTIFKDSYYYGEHNIIL